MVEGIKTALTSIWSNKIRSVLTVLGIVIGVSSVTILISLGQGLRNDVTNLIQGFGSNIVFLIGGKVDTQNPNSMSSNPANLISGNVITSKDVTTIKEVSDVDFVAPMSLVPGSVSRNEQSFAPVIFGTTDQFINALSVIKIKEGRFFKENESENVVVIDRILSKGLFQEESPIGESVLINRVAFEVIGLMEYESAQSLFGDFSNIAAIPQTVATQLNKDREQIHRVVIKINDAANVNVVKDEIYQKILSNHDGEEDFTVLTQEDVLKLMDDFLGLATALVSAIAAISLIVGGIGIMNIMLVTVTERTKEIGLRKAVGATKRDIGLQFLVEAIMVTLVGGIIGLIVSFMVALVVASRTPLSPSITLETILIAVSISTVIGIIFGLWPALRAASKDPIEALRYE